MPSARRSLRTLLIPVLTTLAIATFLRATPTYRQATSQSTAQSDAREALNRGVEAFKNGQYKDAEDLFERAKTLDSQLLNARLYLATTYASQYIPGAPTEENIQMGRRAIEEFKGVLDLNPENLSALDGIGSITFQMAETPFNRDLFVESRSYFQRHIQIAPNDPEPYYWTGVIDWTIAFRAAGEMRQHFNDTVAKLDASEPLPADLRETYAREYGPTIDAGIESMNHALVLQPDYDDAMAYLNLLYRCKANTVVDNEERNRFIKMADDLVDKVKEIKQRRAGETKSDNELF